MSTGNAVPVLMYHSVGRPMPEWRWAFLTVPADIFENHLSALKRAGYRSVDLAELYEHVSGRRPLPARSVVLTFDDGYLDNWTYAAPLLEKYGFKATVVVNPEFVDPRDVVRVTLKDVWNGKSRAEDLEVHGFMSWPELKQVARSGVFSVQSHLMTHTWYPVGPEVVDFHYPGDEYYWLDWNENPSAKPFYLASLEEGCVPWGTPVYRHEKSMAARRFWPPPCEGERLFQYVTEHGGEAFFQNPAWREELFAKLDEVRVKGSAGGRLESEEECRKRIWWELEESKRQIEQNLEETVDHMVWPGGGYVDEVFEAALKVYRSVALSSRDGSDVRNRIGEDPRRIKRLGVPAVQGKKALNYFDGSYLVRYLDEYRGVFGARKIRQIKKVLHLAHTFLESA